MEHEAEKGFGEYEVHRVDTVLWKWVPMCLSIVVVLGVGYLIVV